MRKGNQVQEAQERREISRDSGDISRTCQRPGGRLPEVIGVDLKLLHWGYGYLL